MVDLEDIAITLVEKRPDVNPLTVASPICEPYSLEGFDDDPKTSKTGKLEAIQMAWYEEWKDGH